MIFKEALLTMYLFWITISLFGSIGTHCHPPVFLFDQPRAYCSMYVSLESHGKIQRRASSREQDPRFPSSRVAHNYVWVFFWSGRTTFTNYFTKFYQVYPSF